MSVSAHEYDRLTAVQGEAERDFTQIRIAFFCGCTTDLNFTTRFNARCVLWYYQLCPYYGRFTFLFNIWL